MRPNYSLRMINLLTNTQHLKKWALLALMLISFVLVSVQTEASMNRSMMSEPQIGMLHASHIPASTSIQPMSCKVICAGVWLGLFSLDNAIWNVELAIIVPTVAPELILSRNVDPSERPPKGA